VVTTFQQHVHATVEKKVLLILDNHASHRTLEVNDYARLHGIVILSLPPHTSHKMQPLDKTFFGPLKRYYNQACDHWLVVNPGKRITPYDVASLFAEAYGKCATIPNNVSRFVSTGIFPLNPEIFSEADYAPSTVTHNASDYEQMASTTAMTSMQTNRPDVSAPTFMSTLPAATHSGSTSGPTSATGVQQNDTSPSQFVVADVVPVAVSRLESQPDATELTTVGVACDSGISRNVSACHPPTVHVEFRPRNRSSRSIESIV